MALFGSSLQVLAAIAVVIILFIIAYFIFNREAVNAARQSAVLKNRVDVFKGVKDMAITTGESYNTVNDKAGLYIPLKPSVNQQGGIEFTYNFWLYQDQGFQASVPNTANVPTDSGISVHDIILLLKGKKDVTTYKNICGIDKKDIFIKSPLIKLENYGDALTVEFNTEKSADAVREGARDTCDTISNDWNDKNSHKISLRGIKSKPAFDKKWFMVTVVMQDTYPNDPLPFRNKIRVRIYINGVLELDQYVDNKYEEEENTPPCQIYDGVKFGGGSTISLDVGRYTLQNLVDKGYTDNSIQSFKLRDGYKITLYENGDFTGNSVSFTTSQSDLNAISTTLKNAVSSVVVEVDQLMNNRFDETNLNLSVLKPNDGNLHVMPQISWMDGSNSYSTKRPSSTDLNKVMMADLSYFNYVVNADDVMSMYNNGFNKFYAVGPKGTSTGTDVMNQISYSDGKTRQLIST